MVTKKQKNERRNSLFANLFQSSLTVIISFIISTGLIGGSGYLLFTQSEKQKNIFIALNQLEMETEGIKTWGQLSEVGSRSWITDESNIKKFGLIFNTLNAAKDQPKLEPTFVSTSLDWCDSSLLTLSSEQGIVDGVIVSGADNLVKARQETLSQMYLEQILIIQDVRDLMISWENETSLIRTNKLNSISDKDRNLIALITMINTQSDQIISAKLLEEKYFEQRLNQLTNDVNQMHSLKNWAIIGVTIGIIYFIVLVYGAKKYYFG